MLSGSRIGPGQYGRQPFMSVINGCSVWFVTEINDSGREKTLLLQIRQNSALSFESERLHPCEVDQRSWQGRVWCYLNSRVDHKHSV